MPANHLPIDLPNHSLADAAFRKFGFSTRRRVRLLVSIAKRKVMDEPKNNVGRYRFDIAYEEPPKDVGQRRIDALRAWLLKQFDRRQTEAVNDESSKG